MLNNWLTDWLTDWLIDLHVGLPDETISEGIVGLTDTEGEEASITVNTAGTNTHGVPADLQAIN